MLSLNLGGIILGNYLTKVGDGVRGKLVAAMLISICWDCFEGTLSLEKKGINLMLNCHLANCLTQSIKEVGDLSHLTTFIYVSFFNVIALTFNCFEEHLFVT